MMIQSKLQYYAQLLLGWLFSFVVSIFPIWMVMLMLCFFDRYVGIKAATHRQEALQKSGMRRTLDKIGIYTGWIVLGGMMQRLFMAEIPAEISIARMIGMIVIMTEFDSVIYNISVYTEKDYRTLIFNKIPLIGSWIAKHTPKGRFAREREQEQQDKENDKA